MELRAAKKPFKVRPEFDADDGGVLRLSARHHRHRYRCPLPLSRWRDRTGRAATPSPSARKACSTRAPSRSATSRNGRAGSPPRRCRQREPAKYGQYAEGMPGGGQNPLGARAIYLYANGKDTLSAHPRHDRAGDDRHRFVERLLPHDQRARHRPLPARACGHCRSCAWLSASRSLTGWRFGNDEGRLKRVTAFSSSCGPWMGAGAGKCRRPF